MSNIWVDARKSMTGEVATEMLSYVMVRAKAVVSDYDVYSYARGGLLTATGLSSDDFFKMIKMPMFREWFDDIVSQIWKQNFEAKFTKAT